MKRSPQLLLILGIVLLALGGYMSFARSIPPSDPVQAAACRERMKDAGAEMLSRCSEAAFATAMTATDADQAAAAISASNNKEIGGNAIGMFMLGLGLVMTLAGIVALRKQVRLSRK